MNLRKIEESIFTYNRDKVKLQNIRSYLTEMRDKLAYFVERFLEEFDEYIERQSEKHLKFYKDKTSEYSEVVRLIGIVDAYAN